MPASGAEWARIERHASATKELGRSAGRRDPCKPPISRQGEQDETVGAPASTRNGGAWRPSTIQEMLRNRFYTGRVEFDGDLIRARHDAIVSDVLFNSCQGTGKPA